METAPIVVGADDTPASLKAARYAVGEAATRHCDVRLVHAYGSHFVAAPYSVLQLERVHRAAESFLDAFTTQLDLPDHVRQDRRAYNATAVDALIEAASDAAFVVVGHHAGERGRGLLDRRVAARLSRRAEVPVVTVPAAYELPQTTTRPVVVVLDARTVAGTALDFAFQHAELMGNAVTVLDAAPTEDGAAESRNAAAIARRRAWHPEVGTTVKSVHDATDQVLATSSHASLLVIADPRHFATHRAGRSGIRHAVLKDARCPVAVVPTREPISKTPRTQSWRSHDGARPHQ